MRPRPVGIVTDVDVLCLVPYPTIGASNRLRIEQYVRPLASEGMRLRVSPFLDNDAYRVLYRAGSVVPKIAGVLRGAARRVRDLLRARRYDLIVVHRESAPLGPPLVERALARLGVPYVLDFDDAIFLGPVHPANRRWARLRPPGRLAESARGAVAVIAGNEYLAGFARAWNQDVTVLTTPVDTERHTPGPDRHQQGRPVVIGWVGSSTTAPYLHLIDEPLADVCAADGVTVRVVGGEYENARIRHLDILPYDLGREADDLRRMDIGVLPEPDDEWTKGKGALKALLYMSTALPVVASAVGVNPEVIEHGVTGYVVDDDAGWREALERLVRDPPLRRRLGDAGRARVESRYSLKVMAPRFADVLRRAAAAA